MARIYLDKEYLLYITVKVVSRIVSLLPIRCALWMGKITGDLLYIFHPKRKRVGYANLKAAFSKDKTPNELKRILKSTYENYGRSIMEMLSIPKIDYEYLRKHIDIPMQSRIAQASIKKKGVIFLTIHLGNWELMNLKSAQIGHPLHLLVRKQRHERLNNLLNSYRQKLGCKVVNRGMTTREMIKVLRSNAIVAILSDQDVGKSGVYHDLFGRPTSHAVGAMRIARSTGSSILPVFMIRKGTTAYHRVDIDEPFEVAKSPDCDKDVSEAIQRSIRVFESYISQHPDQWMWVYTRWKSTPCRKVIILSDGKRGHLNQSLAVYNVIRRCRQDAGFKDKDTSYEIIEVRFKNKMLKSLPRLCPFFGTNTCQGCMACLKASLTRESYDKLMTNFADIIISCGSSLSAVNVLLSRENNAKNVVIMKPGPAGIKNFNVAIIPAHDRFKQSHNTVITEGAPSLMSEENMEDGSKRIQAITDVSKRSVLGVLIGGDTPRHSLSLDIVNTLIDQIEDVTEKLDMDLLLTTSRRTPSRIEQLLKSRLKSNGRTKLLLIANEANIDNAVGGILRLSEIVLVSGESISMVSEAASSGKKTVVFDLEKKKAQTLNKHDYAIDRLTKEHYITHPPLDQVGKAVMALSQMQGFQKKLDNNAKMYKELYRII